MPPTNSFLENRLALMEAILGIDMSYSGTCRGDPLVCKCEGETSCPLVDNAFRHRPMVPTATNESTETLKNLVLTLEKTAVLPPGTWQHTMSSMEVSRLENKLKVIREQHQIALKTKSTVLQSSLMARIRDLEEDIAVLVSSQQGNIQ